MHVGLADEDGASRPQTRGDLGILSGEVAFQGLAAGSSSHAHGIDIVFQCDGNSVQRAAELSGHLFLLQFPGLLQRQFAHDADKGVGLRIEGLDSRQTSFGQFHRRDFLSPNSRGGFLQRKHGQFRCVGKRGPGGQGGCGKRGHEFAATYGFALRGVVHGSFPVVSLLVAGLFGSSL